MGCKLPAHKLSWGIQPGCQPGLAGGFHEGTGLLAIGYWVWPRGGLGWPTAWIALWAGGGRCVDDEPTTIAPVVDGQRAALVFSCAAGSARSRGSPCAARAGRLGPLRRRKLEAGPYRHGNARRQGDYLGPNRHRRADHALASRPPRGDAPLLRGRRSWRPTIRHRAANGPARLLRRRYRIRRCKSRIWERLR